MFVDSLSKTYGMPGWRVGFMAGPEVVAKALTTMNSNHITNVPEVVTAAAIIMISVFAGFVFSHDAMIRPIGFGLSFGVLLDAFVVRLLLMPALMHLLGDAAWRLPRWLDRIMPDVDVEGAQLERRTAPADAPAPAEGETDAPRVS